MTIAADASQWKRRHSVGWWTVWVLSAIVVGYGAVYLILRERVFPPDLADSFKARPWGIYPHVVVGMIGLAIGPLQFHPAIQSRVPLHRKLGITYVIIALLVGAVGFYMAMYSFGGVITHVGFGLLAAGLFAFTLNAFREAKRGNFARHREWMLRSYAMMFAAPTLRLWLPLLIIAHSGQFLPAYRWVSWLCWVPNLVFAEWYIRKTRDRPLRFGRAVLRYRGD